MGSLTPEQIKQLLTKPEKTKSSKGKTLDTSRRDARTWFDLNHELFNEETQETFKCENPECVDPRQGPHRNAVVAKINGQHMCRHCFLDGWLLEIEGQVKIDVN